jgi:hypothetical protein
MWHAWCKRKRELHTRFEKHRRRWNSDIKMHVKAAGCKVVDLLHLVQDRKKSRNFGYRKLCVMCTGWGTLRFQEVLCFTVLVT